jgi:hypothetical protein
MTHNIYGFITRRDGLEDSLATFAPAKAMVLAQGFAFIPMGEWAGSTPTAPLPLTTSYAELNYLSAHLADLGCQISVYTPLAFVETEYFGGSGGQGAIVWHQGQVRLGPIRTESFWRDGQFITPPLAEGAINRALRFLGVQASAGLDEFDTLGLGRYRSNEKWLQQAEV